MPPPYVVKPYNEGSSVGIYIVDEADVVAVSRAHGRVFGAIKPANTLVVVAGLIGGYRVEIEAEAMLRGAGAGG